MSAQPKLIGRATYTTMETGQYDAWYLHENIGVCIDTWNQHGPLYGENTVYAWFAEIGWYIPNMCDMYDAWDGKIVSGPYATEEDAFKAANDILVYGNYTFEF